MKRSFFVFLLVGFALGWVVLSSLKQGPSARRGSNAGACCPIMAALESRPIAGTTNPITTKAAVPKVIAYYFHGTVRCHTCLLIENLARMAVEQQFGSDLAASRLRFVPVNYDLPENKHFLADYRLPCPSLVLVRQKDGKDEKWKLLGDTWQLVHYPIKLSSYVESEVRTFLGGEAQSTNTNHFSPIPAPNR